VSGDHLEDGRGVVDGAAENADLIERRRIGDETVSGDETVRRFDPDDPAERRWLANRSARFGTQGRGHDPRRDGGRGTTRAPTRDAATIEGVPRRPVRREFGGRAHAELVEVRLADDRRSCRPQRRTTVASNGERYPSRMRDPQVVG
jgi:hypothetical protein